MVIMVEWKLVYVRFYDHFTEEFPFGEKVYNITIGNTPILTINNLHGQTIRIK